MFMYVCVMIMLNKNNMVVVTKLKPIELNVVLVTCMDFTNIGYVNNVYDIDIWLTLCNSKDKAHEHSPNLSYILNITNH